MKNVIILLIAVFVFSPSYVSANLQAEEAQVLINLGKSLQKSGDIAGAVHEYSKALLADPDNQEAKALLAQCGFSRGLYKPLRTKTIEMTQDVSLMPTQHYSGQVAKLNEDKSVLDSRFQNMQTRTNQLMDENRKKDAQIASMQDKIKHLDDALKNKNMSRDMDLGRSLRDEKIAVREIPQRSNHSNDLEQRSLKVVVDDLENRLKRAETKSDDTQIALAKAQNDMLKTIDGSLERNNQLMATQEKFIDHLSNNINSIQNNKAPVVTSDKSLRSTLSEAQGRIADQDGVLNDQYKQIQTLESDLRESDDQVDRLLKIKSK